MNQPADNSQLVARRLGGAGVMLLVHLAALALTGLIVFTLVPTCQDLLEDFGAELPRITQQVIWLSILFARYWYAILLVILGLDAGILVALAVAAPRQRWLAAVYSYLFLLSLFLVLAWTSVAMFLPIRNLVEALR